MIAMMQDKLKIPIKLGDLDLLDLLLSLKYIDSQSCKYQYLKIWRVLLLIIDLGEHFKLSSHDKHQLLSCFYEQ